MGAAVVLSVVGKIVGGLLEAGATTATGVSFFATIVDIYCRAQK